MKILLDTHTALWLVNDYEKLSHMAKEMLLDEANTLYISTVSVWEIAIKASLGKLTEFDGGASSFLNKLEDMPISMLPIMPSHVENVEVLPFIHSDPFDRMLVATAMAENMSILTKDEYIQRYDVPSVW